MKNFDFEKESGSVFNMGIATLQRIDSIIRRMAEYRVIGLAVPTYRLLIQLYKELRPFLNNPERKDSKEYIEKIGKQFINDIDDSVEFGFNFKYLDAFEFWIRDKLYEKGLLMAQSDDPGVAL